MEPRGKLKMGFHLSSLNLQENTDELKLEGGCQDEWFLRILYTKFIFVYFNSVCNHTRDNKIGRPRSGSPICLSRVWLQIELDDTKSYYQLIIKITISEKRRIPRYKRKGKFALKDWQRRRKLFNVSLKLTTVKMDLLVAKWWAKNKSYVSQRRNPAWKTHNCAEQLTRIS